MPPRSLGAAPLPSPWPTPSVLAWVWAWAWEGAWPQFISARSSSQGLPRLPASHRSSPKGRRVLPPVPDCALMSSTLVSPNRPAWGFRTSCQMDKRKEAPDWLVEEGVGLEPPVWPHKAGVSFWGQRGTLADFQDKHL